ncbi:MAG: 4Fe-4S binding protein [Roseiflexaceae bacterium]|nr:4Fe-4S binding protein [Roseiflexaceae bacterium]
MAIHHTPKRWFKVGTHHLRRLTQALFTLFIGVLVVSHLLVGESATTTTTTSAEAFCPFGGVETLYQYVASGGSFINHTHLSNVVLLVAVLALTVVARGAFCGWFCPFGAIQEWLYAASTWLQKRIPPVGRAIWALKKRLGVRPARLGMLPEATLIQRIDGILRYGKYAVLATIIGGTIAYGVMIFRDYDPWSALLEIGALELTAGTVVLGIVLVAALFVERPWCRYACPLGAVIGLTSQLSPLRIQREGTACTGCTLCSKSCPMGLPVATMSELTHRDCVMCLECVDACPQPGALDLKLVVPGMPARPSEGRN